MMLGTRVKLRKQALGLILVVVCAVVIFSISAPRIVSSRPRHFSNSDFFSFWLAARMLMEEGDPYLEQTWIEGHAAYGATWVSDPTFLYPPALAVIFAPLGRLGLFQAFSLWVFLSMVFAFLGTALLADLYSSGAGALKYFLPALAGVFLFRPLIATLLEGQLGGLLFLVLVLAVTAFWNSKYALGGVWIGLVLVKPNLGLVLNGLIGCYAIISRRWKIAAGQLIGGAVILLLSELSRPGWMAEYWQILQEKGNQTLGWSPTLWGLAGIITAGDRGGVLILGSVMSLVAILAVALMIIKAKTQIGPFAAAMLGICLMTISTPYLWGYDQIYLLIPIFSVSFGLKNDESPYLLTASLPVLFSLVAAALAVVGLYLEHDIASVLLSALTLCLAAWYFLIHQSTQAAESILPKCKNTE